jgi:hypothetical protein
LPLSSIRLRHFHQLPLQPIHERLEVLGVHASDSADPRLRAVSCNMPQHVAVIA